MVVQARQSRRQVGFISVGAICQYHSKLNASGAFFCFLLESGRRIPSELSNSEPILRDQLIAGHEEIPGGVSDSWSVLRSSLAAGRVDSSLRSHRTRRSQCRHVYSGLNKTLYASVGPNSRYRGHQSTLSAMPESLASQATLLALLQRPGQPGRMKPCRGHRRDATCQPKLDVEQLPPLPSEILKTYGSKGFFFSSNCL